MAIEKLVRDVEKAYFSNKREREEYFSHGGAPELLNSASISFQFHPEYREKVKKGEEGGWGAFGHLDMY